MVSPALVATAILLVVLLLFVYFSPVPAKLPDGVANGDVIRCAATGGIYLIENGTKRWYPDMETYIKHGRPAYKSANCAIVSNIPAGPNMI